MAAANYLSPDAGAVMQRIREFLIQQFADWFSNSATIEWTFGVTLGKQSCTAHVTFPDVGTEEFVFINAGLNEGDVMPFRSMMQLPGFEGWSTLGWSVEGFPPVSKDDAIAYWKANIADVKSEMIITWSYGEPRAILYDNVDIVPTDATSYIAMIAVADANGMSVSQELFYVVNGGTLAVPGMIWTDSNSGVPGGTAGANLDTSRVAKALEVISMTNYELSFNHGGTVWSVNGGFITG